MKNEPILKNYTPFFSDLTVLPHKLSQIKLLFDHTKCFGEESKFLWKMTIFGNFGPLGAAENIKIF
jgi:hypothetical protein